MAEPTIQLGGGNWAGKTDNLLGYYKEGERFYKQDFTFSRSTTGTYTDSDGYIQEMPYNLLTYSEDFSNAAWLKTSGVTVTSNYGISPDGKQNSTRLQFASNNEQVYDGIVHSGNTETASIYVKGQSGITMQFGVGSNISQGSTYTLTGEWQRLEHQSTSGSLFIIGNKDLTATDIEIWGAQLVKGTSAKTYFPTTTRLNMPRVDYLNNSNGSLILEPQRTNVVTESSDFSTYSSQNITTLANNSTSPDGTINANKATPNTANGQHRYTPSYSVTSSTKYAASVFAKKDGYNKIRITENATTGGYADFDLLNGQVLSTSNVDSAKIEYYGNGWYRCIMVETTGSTSFRFDIIVLDDDNNTSFVGDGTSSVLLWGAQLEAGSYATTLINTSGSSVTRNADACSITNVADRIGQTEGTIYVEFKSLTILGNQMIIDVSDNSSSDRVGLQIASTVINAFRVSPSDTTSLISSSTISENTLYKCAFAYKNGRHAFYLNGSKIGEDTNSITSMSLNKIDVGQRFNNTEKFSGSIIDSKLYNTALTDTELATLTTL
jgi:hypothetical protein